MAAELNFLPGRQGLGDGTAPFDNLVFQFFDGVAEVYLGLFGSLLQFLYFVK
jgi:hypothetical protein